MAPPVWEGVAAAGIGVDEVLVAGVDEGVEGVDEGETANELLGVTDGEGVVVVARTTVLVIVAVEVMV